MPYYIYKIHAGKRLEYLAEFEEYKEAKKFVREHREEQASDTAYTVKIMFAKNTSEAESVLSKHREAPILMEHEK